MAKGNSAMAHKCVVTVFVLRCKLAHLYSFMKRPGALSTLTIINFDKKTKVAVVTVEFSPIHKLYFY